MKSAVSRVTQSMVSSEIMPYHAVMAMLGKQHKTAFKRPKDTLTKQHLKRDKILYNKALNTKKSKALIVRKDSAAIDDSPLPLVYIKTRKTEMDVKRKAQLISNDLLEQYVSSIRTCRNRVRAKQEARIVETNKFTLPGFISKRKTELDAKRKSQLNSEKMLKVLRYSHCHNISEIKRKSKSRLALPGKDSRKIMDDNKKSTKKSVVNALIDSNNSKLSQAIEVQENSKMENLLDYEETDKAVKEENNNNGIIFAFQPRQSYKNKLVQQVSKTSTNLKKLQPKQNESMHISPSKLKTLRTKGSKSVGYHVSENLLKPLQSINTNQAESKMSTRIYKKSLRMPTVSNLANPNLSDKRKCLIRNLNSNTQQISNLLALDTGKNKRVKGCDDGTSAIKSKKRLLKPEFGTRKLNVRYNLEQTKMRPFWPKILPKPFIVKKCE